MLFLERITEHTRQRPDKTALEMTDDRLWSITYGRLETAVQQHMTALLAHGVQAGDRVALQLPKGLPFIYLHLAIMRLGAITLPLNPAYPPDELAYFLADAEVRLFFAAEDARPSIETVQERLPALKEIIYLDAGTGSWAEATAVAAHLPDPPADPNQTALMIYTSGTTGRPKGAEITHGNLTANLDALHTAWGWREDDVLLHVLPIFHVHGLVVALHGALHAGATAVLLPRFDAVETLQTLVDRRYTVFMAVPTIHRRLVDAPGAAEHDLSHLRLMTSGSDRLPDDLFRRFEETFGHTLLERYGMTETGMNLSNPLHGERRVGSVGLPLPGVEARIVDPATEQPLPDGDVGEVHIRGAHVCKGYWRQPEKTAAAFTSDGWLRTGDLGRRDADGYFTLHGRAKDLIITGGMNVYPPEVERVLATHPAVAAAAVIGCPDDQWGERVTAVVITRSTPVVDSEALIAYCRERLAPYKTPRTILFVAEFPRNALGKVQKAQLRQRLCGVKEGPG